MFGKRVPSIVHLLIRLKWLNQGLPNLYFWDLLPSCPKEFQSIGLIFHILVFSCILIRLRFLARLDSLHVQYCIPIEGGYLLVELVFFALLIGSTVESVQDFVLQPHIFVDSLIIHSVRQNPPLGSPTRIMEPLNPAQRILVLSDLKSCFLDVRTQFPDVRHKLQTLALGVLIILLVFFQFLRPNPSMYRASLFFSSFFFMIVSPMAYYDRPVEII